MRRLIFRAPHLSLVHRQMLVGASSLTLVGMMTACSGDEGVGEDASGGSVGNTGGGGPNGAGGSIGNGAGGGFSNSGGGTPTDSGGSGPGAGGGSNNSGGGSTGVGGSGPTAGGSPGAGGNVVGAGGGGDGGGGGGGGSTVACNITISKSEVANSKRTVGLVDFTTDMTGATGASVEFGMDTTYGMTAPAESAGGGYSTWLVGMKPNTTYHYRVVVSGPSGDCVGPDQTIESGPLAQGTPSPTQVDVGQGSAGGFIVGSVGDYAVILDKDGDVVWAHDFGDTLAAGAGSFIGLTAVRLSWDAKYMYGRNLGPFDAASGGVMARVPIDGSSGEESVPVSGGNHHDFTVIPDGIAYITKEAAGQCDHIYTANADGSNASSLVNLGVVFEQYPQAGFGTEACHVNAINYYPGRELYSVSDREKDAIAVFDSSGNLTMAIGQQPSGNLPLEPIIAEGATTDWRVQHGHHLYADDKLAVFSNHSMGSPTSPVLHYTINGTQATLDWQYTEHPSSGTQGDVDYLPNGNFLVTSTDGQEIHEVDGATRSRVSRYTFQARLGYTTHRLSLYGPPPAD